MKKVVIFGCLGIVLIILTAVGLVGYKISRAVSGALKPRDLGLRATMEQANQVQEKTTVSVLSLPSDTNVTASIRFEGSHPKTYELNSSELTALALSHGRYKYFPFSSVQIRVNSDNTVEISCVADTMKAFSYATAIGFAAKDLEKVMSDYKIPRSSIPIYVKGSGSVADGKVTLNLSAGEVAGIPVPMNIVNEKKSEIIGVLEDGLRNTQGLVMKSLTFSDGKVHFDGNVPDKKYIVE